MLSPAWSDAADVALARLLEATEAQERAAQDAFGDSWWQVATGLSPLQRAWTALVGSESAVEALATNARAARTLYAVMAAKRPNLVSDVDAHSFVRDCGEYAEVGDLIDTAYSLTAWGGLSEIARETADDLADVAPKLGLGVVLVAALAIVFLLKR